MSARPANDFVFTIDLDEAEVRLLSDLGVEDLEIGANLFSSDEATWLQHRPVESDEGLFENDRFSALGLRIATLMNKLYDHPACTVLRRRAAEGDGRAAFDLALMKNAGAGGLMHPEEAARLFMQAHRSGVAEAIHKLVWLHPDLREEVGLDEDARALALEAMALDGDPAAALELAYGVIALPRERLIPILRAVQDGSSEAREYLAELEAEPAT